MNEIIEKFKFFCDEQSEYICDQCDESDISTYCVGFDKGNGYVVDIFYNEEITKEVNPIFYYDENDINDFVKTYVENQIEFKDQLDSYITIVKYLKNKR